MKQLRLLMMLEDCGVDSIYHDGKELYFLPRRDAPPPVIPAELMAELCEEKAWFMLRVKRLPAASLCEVLT